MIAPIPSLQAVEVTWTDAVSGHGWRPFAAWQEWLKSSGALQVSLGYLVAVQDEWVAIAQSRESAGAGNLSEVIQVPTAVIVSIRELA
mgnify:CR=1 FL=1